MEKMFDLNVEKVLENWDVTDGIREVIANALDEQILTNTAEIKIFEAKEGWHIRDFGRGLNYKHLTQKENQEKLFKPELVIGKFGVGLKDALATFDRHKINVKILSKFGTITIQKSQKHGFEDLKTLHAVITEKENNKFEGTEFILSGVTKDQINKAKSNFLKFSNEKLLEKNQYGEIYEKQGEEAIIYITGLKVAVEEKFLFSYNITSMTKKLRRALNRERSNVGRTAYVDRVKDTLLEAKTPKVAELLAEDFKKFDAGTSHDEVAWIDVSVHACKLLNQNKKAVFATTSDLILKKDSIDDAIKDGYEIITIPETVKSKIQGLKDYDGKTMRTVSEYINEFNESFQFKFVKEQDLTPAEKQVLSTKDKIFDLIGGKPKQITKIKISETMRKDINGFEVNGLWQGDGTIIIKRDQLKNLKDFAGTLLHESAHATSGQPDVSREFETELTKIIGTIATKQVPKSNK